MKAPTNSRLSLKTAYLGAAWIGLLCSILALTLANGATNYPTPIGLGQEKTYPYNFTGLIENAYYYGSGVVARNPKIVISCAHVTYDWHWLKNAHWHWAWNSESYPKTSDGLLMNGYVYWDSYAQAVWRYGEASNSAFELDLVGYFNYSTDVAGGGYAGAWADGVSALLTTSPKLITGYPSGRYVEGDRREFQMHSTGYFTSQFHRERGRYLGLDGVETGAGNSGGPAWVSDGTTLLLAGVLVSGLEKSIDGMSSVGIVGLDKPGWDLIDSALAKAAVVTQSFTNTNIAPVPDPGSLTRSIKVSGMPKTIKALQVALNVAHERRGDLVITLRSPSGRTITLFQGRGFDTRPNVAANSVSYSNFDGLNPNGDWILTVRDRLAGNAGLFQSLVLKISAK